MGHVIRSRETLGDWRVCGISDAVPALRHSDTTVPDRFQKGSRLGDPKLENHPNGSDGVEFLDSGRVRAALGPDQASKGYSRLRRFGIGAIFVWAIVSTALNAMTLMTVLELSTVIDQMNYSAEVAQVQQANAKY
jgi:hypothetical protein